MPICSGVPSSPPTIHLCQRRRCAHHRTVSKLSQLSKLVWDNNNASESVAADRLHTMFLAMADARAVLIKLADRLHNMITSAVEKLEQALKDEAISYHCLSGRHKSF
ncbi:unnamed protein product [Fraxinus pennsylvanica]|uniref:Uncharacterized protein n=1 Tax=Fraxinus pennsylvanica TaxID=56036 RepID=A0AAD2DII1_9LAMI|nr:unnamed protein product [Fraxinus pennsylvanica]